MSSGPFHKYGDVVSEGFFVQTRREHQAYPPVICEVRATPSARKRPTEYVSGFTKWTTTPSLLSRCTPLVLIVLFAVLSGARAAELQLAPGLVSEKFIDLRDPSAFTWD